MTITRSLLTDNTKYSASRWGIYTDRLAAIETEWYASVYCMGGFFGDDLRYIYDKTDTAWAKIHLYKMSDELWEYRRPYVEEVVDMFQGYLPDAELVYTQWGPEVIYSIEHGDYKEPIHAFNVSLRHTWEHLAIWPVQPTSPTVKDVWMAWLEHYKWDSRELGYVVYLSHSNFCVPTGPSRYIGLTAETYVNMMCAIWKEQRYNNPSQRVPSFSDPTMKSYLFRQIINEYAENTKTPKKEWNPFNV